MSDARALQYFPVLTEAYQRGVYQLKPALLYFSKNVSDGGLYEIFVEKNNPGIFQARIQSRHVSSKSYSIFSGYSIIPQIQKIQLNNGNVSEDRMRGW